ncbi:MAG: hypothetical protein J7577_13340 [Sphingobacteriaceae bacterium]|nr:hypothetical protein [Sphingobacteriaceae bacterium]
MNFDKPKTLEEVIIKAAAVHFGMTVQEFTENPRCGHNFTYQRYVCFHLLKQETLLSNAEISKMFERKESVVKHGNSSINGLKSVKDKRTIADISDIYLLINKFTSIKKFNDSNIFS